SRSPTSVPPSASNAPRSTRWGRRWFPRKEPVRPTIITAVFGSPNVTEECGPMSDPANFDGWSCPAPPAPPGQVLLGHGSGGRLTAELMRQTFLPEFRTNGLEALEDQATLALACAELHTVRLAFTTDSFVVRPIFFPGGDIGKLAVNGTINDLA